MLLRKMFPDAMKRAKIIARREEILGKLHPVIVAAMTGADMSAAQVHVERLMKVYPPEDVVAAMKQVMSRLDRNKADAAVGPEDQEANRYRHYVATYRRFGGDRRFVGRQEFFAIVNRLGEIGFAQARGKKISAAQLQRAEADADLLLSNVDLWEDITPESPPRNLPDVPRPEDIK